MPSIANRIRPRAVLSALLALILGGSIAEAQSSIPANRRRVETAADVTFEMLAHAPFETCYVANRTRRFLDNHGMLTSVRERITMSGGGSLESPFRLEFSDLMGQPMDPATAAKWTETYRTSAGVLHMHGEFRVHDPVLAARNYGLYDFGVVHRLGRDARRVVIFPRRMDKGIWVVDVDAITGVPLYSAEYDSSLRLINDLETTLFSQTSIVDRGSVVGATGVAGGASWGWQPRMIVNRFADYATALQAPNAPTQSLSPAIQSIVAEYSPSMVQITEDPVNGDRTLVLGYTDGVDEFFVLQSTGPQDPFKAIFGLSKNGKVGATHAIATYDDPAMRAYVFFQGGLMFQVLGRSSLTRLEDVSVRVLRQAVTGV